jgi:hypothetical protein
MIQNNKKYERSERRIGALHKDVNAWPEELF